MKVLLRQSGGGIPPFVYYEPFSYAGGVESSAAQAGGSSSDSESKLTDKDLFTMLKEMKGLPSDISEIMRTLSRVFAGDSLFANGSIDTSNLSNLYLKALHKMKIAEFNQKYYDEARKEVIDKGGLSEVAITDHGHIVVADEDGKITNVSVEELYENQDKYTPITNSDLFHIRAHNKSFDNTIIKMAQNGVGMNYVNEEIRKYLNDIGTNEVSQSGYSRTKNRQIQEGIEYLQMAVRNGADLNGMNMDGVYKSKILTKDQQSKAKIAINHIWEDGLDNPSKTLLKYKGGGEEGGKAILARYVLSSLDSTINFDVDAVKDPLDVANGSSGSGTQPDSNPYLQMMKEEGGEQRRLTIMNREDTGAMSVNGTWYGQLPKVNQDMSIDQLLSTGLQGIVQSRDNITFGDQKIGSEHLKDIMYDNKGGTIVTLPVTIDMSGAKTVDLSILDKYNEAINEVDKYKNTPQYFEKLAQAFKDRGLDELLDENSLPDTSMFGQFLVVDAYTTDKIDFDKKSKYIEKVQNPDKDLEERLERGLSTNINDKASKPNKPNYGVDAKDKWTIFEWGWDNIYRANLFIPIINNPNAAINAWGDQWKVPFVENNENEYQMWKKMQQYNSSNNSSQLNL